MEMPSVAQDSEVVLSIRHGYPDIKSRADVSVLALPQQAGKRCNSSSMLVKRQDCISLA